MSNPTPVTPMMIAPTRLVSGSRLDDLLDDPLVRQVMDRDGVVRADLAALIHRTLPQMRAGTAGHDNPAPAA